MVDIKICGLSECRLWSWWPTHTLSIVDPGVVESSGPHHLVVEMHDVESSLDKFCPLRSHVDQVLAFTADLKPTDKLLVHCFAGMRRSTAAAIGIMIQHGMAIPDAFSHCYDIRSIMMPNRLVLRLMDAALDLNGELAAFGNHWVQNAFEQDRQNRPALTAAQNAIDAVARTSEMKRILGLIG